MKFSTTLFIYTFAVTAQITELRFVEVTLWSYWSTWVLRSQFPACNSLNRPFRAKLLRSWCV